MVTEMCFSYSGLSGDGGYGLIHAACVGSRAEASHVGMNVSRLCHGSLMPKTFGASVALNTTLHNTHTAYLFM